MSARTTGLRGRRPRLTALVALLLAVSGTLLVAPAASGDSAATVARPKPTQVRPISGERVTFTGTVPARSARGVRLVRQQGDSWVRVDSGRTDARGRYSLATRVIKQRGKATVRYRVVAPAFRRDGRTRPKAVSRTRTLAPVGQSAALRVSPSTATAPAEVTLTAVFTPIRYERPVRFQQLVGGRWQTIARGVQDLDGRAEHDLVLGAGTYRVRALTVRADGAATAVAPTRTITVTPAP